ncbi:NAD(P)-dependent dehydrogenase (short-subunit alcohol dehydrogenase family) [Allocatelliglobosispora scoriae]|uniref:NAD(P)-dependent dehydrogenase (Short-subunit alcohol dehydrogenase family) n=1 Tax=Allocatelliglobosispora scoriae TaxID=643052 RepID=A0A841BHN5_9ACTN|nr:SDR family NAD(P)-dependent oxidoreductase [Allocatelliglobosispora scoriae]MBB5866838.1 NAD(P)-dependent dehydrogenase (short-subunit alcohol dehydrogenase family) [Allocatelliglobosispora scoriae]
MTGAGRGIGRAVAVKLAGQGHRVVLVARSRSELIETGRLCRTETRIHVGDVTEPGAAEEMFSLVEREWGPVEVFVSSAGRNRSARLADIDDEHWQEMLDLNLTAVFRGGRRAIGPMVSAGWGRIIVISSVAGKSGFKYLGAYAAAKHGVVGLVRSAALELAPDGVTVNAVCPSFVDTPLTRRTIAAIVDQAGWDPARATEHVGSLQPIGRMVTAEEVAEAVWALVVNGAVTGQSVHVDGGLLHA